LIHAIKFYSIFLIFSGNALAENNRSPNIDEYLIESRRGCPVPANGDVNLSMLKRANGEMNYRFVPSTSTAVTFELSDCFVLDTFPLDSIHQNLSRKEHTLVVGLLGMSTVLGSLGVFTTSVPGGVVIAGAGVTATVATAPIEMERRPRKKIVQHIRSMDSSFVDDYIDRIHTAERQCVPPSTEDFSAEANQQAEDALAACKEAIVLAQPHSGSLLRLGPLSTEQYGIVASSYSHAKETKVALQERVEFVKLFQRMKSAIELCINTDPSTDFEIIEQDFDAQLSIEAKRQADSCEISINNAASTKDMMPEQLGSQIPISAAQSHLETLQALTAVVERQAQRDLRAAKADARTWWYGRWTFSIDDEATMVVRFQNEERGSMWLYNNGNREGGGQMTLTRRGVQVIGTRNGVDVQFTLDPTNRTIRTANGTELSQQ